MVLGWKMCSCLNYLKILSIRKRSRFQQKSDIWRIKYGILISMNSTLSSRSFLHIMSCMISSRVPRTQMQTNSDSSKSFKKWLMISTAAHVDSLFYLYNIWVCGLAQWLSVCFLKFIRCRVQFVCLFKIWRLKTNRVSFWYFLSL